MLSLRSFLAAMMLSACLPMPGVGHWQWSRNPEPDVASYRIETHSVEALLFSCGPFVPVCQEGCMQDDPGCCVCMQETCISYSSTAPILAAIEPQEPLGSTDICTDWDWGDQAGTIIPSLQSVLFVNVRAVDSAGNVSN